MFVSNLTFITHTRISSKVSQTEKCSTDKNGHIKRLLKMKNKRPHEENVL